MPARTSSLRDLIHAMVVGAAVAIGCTSDPLPLAAQAGATIALPISGEALQEQEIGYGGTLLAEVGRYDFQRGELEFHFSSANPTHSFTKSPRIVTRAGPDPGSSAAFGSLFDVPGISQVLALVDIPSNAQPGPYTLQVRRCRRTRPGGTCQPISPDLTFSRPFTVLAGPGAPNQELAFIGQNTYGTKEFLRELYPYPKIVFQVTNLPAATRAVITYPASRMTVQSVFEEQYGGSQSIVSWHDDATSGQIVVDIVDPTRRFTKFAIAFDLKAPPPGTDVQRLTLNDVQVISSASYDLNGAPLAANVTKFAIR
jgi:hypothetical protein